MAKKREPKIIHPVTLLESLTAFRDDANHLLATSNHVLSFLTDDGLDAEKVIKATAPMLTEAVERMRKWNEAD